MLNYQRVNSASELSSKQNKHMFRLMFGTIYVIYVCVLYVF